jgi:hypothetical protein
MWQQYSEDLNKSCTILNKNASLKTVTSRSKIFIIFIEKVVKPLVCDNTVLKNKRTAPMSSNGLFLTCKKICMISLIHLGTYNITYKRLSFYLNDIQNMLERLWLGWC